jgi:hypothetical protein
MPKLTDLHHIKYFLSPKFINYVCHEQRLINCHLYIRRGGIIRDNGAGAGAGAVSLVRTTGSGGRGG